MAPASWRDCLPAAGERLEPRGAVVRPPKAATHSGGDGFGPSADAHTSEERLQTAVDLVRVEPDPAGDFLRRRAGSEVFEHVTLRGCDVQRLRVYWHGVPFIHTFAGETFPSKACAKYDVWAGARRTSFPTVPPTRSTGM